MDVSVGVADSFQDNEDSIVDFIATLASVIQDSGEILDRDEGRGSRELLLSGIVSNIGLRSSLGALDCGLNLENNYACLISKIPDIQDIREAISTGFIDIDDFDVLIRTFKPIIEMCRPENISVLLQNGGPGLQRPPLNSIPRDLSCENGMKEAPWPGKRSLFPPFILAMLESITKHANHSNIRLVMFQICREIVGALISCGWKDDDVLTWLSRPALSDLLISLAECGPESDPTEQSQGGLAKKKSCCSSCHIKDVVLSSILSRVVEAYSNLRANASIETHVVDNLALCLSISNRILHQYHPSCYLEQASSSSDRGYKSWWTLKSELLRLISHTKGPSTNKDMTTLSQISLYLFNQLDSSHLTLKRVSTKSHLYKNLTINKHYSHNGCFFNEYLYGSAELDLPACLQSILFNP